jgi:hypothetical protein
VTATSLVSLVLEEWAAETYLKTPPVTQTMSALAAQHPSHLHLPIQRHLNLVFQVSQAAPAQQMPPPRLLVVRAVKMLVKERSHRKVRSQRNLAVYLQRETGLNKNLFLEMVVVMNFTTGSWRL